MPLCCFTHQKTKETIEKFVKPGTKWVRHRGKVYRRDIAAEHGESKVVTSGIWPKVSYAAGVHPDQVPQAEEVDQRAGVPTDYTSGGDPIFRSHQHRKKYLKAHNLVDYSGFD